MIDRLTLTAYICRACSKQWDQDGQTNPIIICPSCNHHEHIQDIIARESDNAIDHPESSNDPSASTGAD